MLERPDPFLSTRISSGASLIKADIEQVKVGCGGLIIHRDVPPPPYHYDAVREFSQNILTACTIGKITLRHKSLRQLVNNPDSRIQIPVLGAHQLLHSTPTVSP
jgi:hypothetical protein